MTTARRARWSGVLVSSSGEAVLLRGTTGSVVVPAQAAPVDFASVLYSDSTQVYYSDNTPVEYTS